MTTISIYIGLRTSCFYYYICGIKGFLCINDSKNKNQFKGFKYFTHIISCVDDCELKFEIPNGENNGYNNLKLFKNGNGDETIQIKKGGSGYNQVYVYFYGDDPRPLLFCYGTDAFMPRGKDKYDKVWEKVEDIGNIKKCECQDKGEDSNCCKLLEQLVKVVGFLNTVDLSKYPPGTENGKCAGTSSVVGTANTCNAATEKNGQANTCTYDVHRYGGKQVKVRVTCSDVKRNEVSGSGTNCNYKKLTHTPAGMCVDGSSPGGDNSAKGFRLGNVLYNNNGGEKGKIPYYIDNGPSNNNRSDNWWRPLIQVTAYFYDEDKHYSDPLLVELVFKNGEGKDNGKSCDGEGTVCEYYKLTCRDTDNMKWTINKSASGQMSSNPSQYLDSIRYGLKKVLQIKLECKSGTYQLRGRDASTDTGTGTNGFTALNGGSKTITVDECKTGVCEKLKSSNYKCFVHKISTISDFEYNLIAGLAFTIPGASGKDIVIPLYNDTTDPNCNNDTPIELKYNKCMGDVYVFFYGMGRGTDGNDVDTVPLMLWYDKGYYSPCDRDKYFEKWVQVPNLVSAGKPCENDGDGNKLAEQLDIVNKALNRIDLEKSNKVSKGTGYGLPDQVEGSSGIVKVNKTSFKIERVKLTRQQGPSQPPDNHAYFKIVHRTVNGYIIGDIKSNGGKNELTTTGFCVKGTGEGGGVTIEVKKNGSNGDHTALANSNKWNTVVAYYSKNDENFQLPQLIVILKTNDVGDPVTASSSEKSYGYYILCSKSGASGSGRADSGGVNYEYKWVNVTNGQQEQTPFKLDDATDFSLLNSIVILLEQRPKNGVAESYNEGQIGKAIKSALEKQPNIRSPGNPVRDVNRITGKTINVRDATGTAVTCLSTTGFKVFTHDISSLVTLNGLLQKNLSGVNLIAGLRFLIPTCEEGKYTQLTLSDNSSGDLYLYYQNSIKTVSVYFYDRDPRPLLLCYKDTAYRPMHKIFYFIWWDKVCDVKKCECDVGCSDCNKLLKALADVSDFLNPLNIKEVPTNGEKNSYCYKVHKFNGKEIKIKVESEQASKTFCYHKYTHTHCGTSDCESNGGTGFRLGTINYGCWCIKLNGSSSTNCNCITSTLNGDPPDKYKSADKVVVFYYKHDNEHKFPMVVAMGTTSGVTTMCTLFYTLVDKGNKFYKKVEEKQEFDLDDDKEVTKKLDAALFGNSNQLQIILDKRPMPKLYCPPKPPESAQINGETVKYTEEYKPPFTCVDKENNQQRTAGKKNPSDDVIPPSYQALLNNSKGAPLANGAATPTPTPKTTANTTKTVKVTQVDCWQLTNHGYRCYEHKVQGVDGVEEIGGLKFFLWDNRKDKGGSGGGAGAVCGTSGSSPGGAGAGSGAGCPSTAGTDTTCKELCLYKDTSSPSSAGTSSCPAVGASSESSQSNCGSAPGKNGQLTSSLPYTTCKGNVYVFFYGDDPRPLLLCFAGNAYGPRCMAEYECRWVCVVSGCGVVKEGKPECTAVCRLVVAKHIVFHSQLVVHRWRFHQNMVLKELGYI